jgi:hypothetical protein
MQSTQREAIMVCTMIRNREGFYVFIVNDKTIACVNQLGRTHSAHKSRKMHSTKAQRKVVEIIAKLYAMGVEVIEPGIGVGNEYRIMQNNLNDCYGY